MREILFRGKCMCDGEWIEGSLRKFGYYADIAYREPNCSEFINVFEVDPETVGQYTGLRDCKRTAEYPEGQMIFEGDIIKIPDNYDEFGIYAGEVYEIYFHCGGFRLKPKYSKARGFWLEDDRMVEIIGNIHDNPELLKEGGE